MKLEEILNILVGHCRDLLCSRKGLADLHLFLAMDLHTRYFVDDLLCEVLLALVFSPILKSFLANRLLVGLSCHLLQMKALDLSQNVTDGDVSWEVRSDAGYII